MNPPDLLEAAKAVLKLVDAYHHGWTTQPEFVYLRRAVEFTEKDHAQFRAKLEAAYAKMPKPGWLIDDPNWSPEWNFLCEKCHKGFIAPTERQLTEPCECGGRIIQAKDLPA